ncbi:long-chain fatty acid--CoA ligase [Leptospira langatensis]|uniref:Long-chain fatty acid--CoA ligase n=1 Tax=Leptospira langatensis TaxID=2484983 RepID=A0A5F1ZXU7_9LEPT|nr:AMP-binding protein [Leptospira langatensis]TGK03232.1 long-chain fatty acid--CoA ligase [Leptospira langatensis]TGL42407.1 long-chain fatty acid--CoA ligase [Leptospira langatensis]
METDQKYFYDMLERAASRFPNKESFARRTKDGIKGRTFLEIKSLVDALVAGFISEGVQKDDKFLYLCDASQNWIIGDIAIVTSGAVSVPRGTDVVDEDILYIVNHSESKYALVQKEKDKQRLIQLGSKLPSLKKVFVMEDDIGNLKTGEGSLSDLIEKGKVYLSSHQNCVKQRMKEKAPNELATLIYTSGTTGAPKGVMLNQTGWISAVEKVIGFVQLNSSDSGVSLLPPWHAFERAIEYCIVELGAGFLVSNINNLKEDLKDFQPTLFPSVPRIWESLYNGIVNKVSKESALKKAIFDFFLKIGHLWATQKGILFGYDFHIKRPNLLLRPFAKLLALINLILLSPLKLGAILVFRPIHKALGGKLRVSVSAGSALPSVVDKFLSSIGLIVLEGYGMTETSAVLSIRKPKQPSPGTVGTPIQGYECILKDEHGNLVPPGGKGSLWVKSKQVLMGYYKRPELNEVVFDKNGFFDTGDIMRFNYRNELVFAGRAKDTIVLAGGENVEPVPIEDQLLNSPYVNQVMVTGHESKYLVALIVPDFERLKAEFPDLPEDLNSWNTHPKIREIFKKEVSERISRKNGFKSFEVVPQNAFYILPRPFDPDKEMTRTLKMKRNEILESFKKEVSDLTKN